jgi:hypothetical protein
VWSISSIGDGQLGHVLEYMDGLEGHPEALFWMFAYLKKCHNAELVNDPSDPVIEETEFEAKDWTSSEFGHLEGKEEMPPNIPEPRGQGLVPLRGVMKKCCPK